jgi:hypothetical protein
MRCCEDPEVPERASDIEEEPKPEESQVIDDPLEEMQRENPDDHCSSK